MTDDVWDFVAVSIVIEDTSGVFYYKGTDLYIQQQR